jgi:hypothetical protein
MEGTEVREASQHEDIMEEGQEAGFFDSESIVIRRADPDDTDAIINLVEIGEDDHYNRVYSYPKILKLIETAYMAITVIDRDTGAVVAFAACEDYPQVSDASLGLNDLQNCVFANLDINIGPTRYGRRPSLQLLGAVAFEGLPG